MWWFIAGFVLSLAISFAMPIKVPGQKAPSLNDIEVPTAEDGREIPVLFGTRDINNLNVVWWGDVRVVPIKKKGGKK